MLYVDGAITATVGEIHVYLHRHAFAVDMNTACMSENTVTSE